MKDIFNKFDIPTPKHIVLKRFNENYLKKLHFPIIIKPADCNSSKGVTKVNNKKDFNIAFNISKSFSRTKTCVVEEFIDGKEFSIDVYVDKGKPHILTISEIFKIPIENKFIIYRSKCISKINKNITKQIENILNKIVKAFNLSNSPLLIQVIVKDNKVYVLEFSARTGGGEKFITIKKMTGVDIIKILVDLTLKKKINIRQKKNKYQYIFSEFLYCNPGIYNHIIGVKNLLKDKVLDNFMIFKPKETNFESINSSGDRVAGFIINANAKKELVYKHNKVISTLKVLDNNNNDIVRHDLLNTKI